MNDTELEVGMQVVTPRGTGVVIAMGPLDADLLSSEVLCSVDGQEDKSIFLKAQVTPAESAPRGTTTVLVDAPPAP